MERKIIFSLFAWFMVCSMWAQPRLSREQFRAKEQAYITAKASLTEQEAVRFFPLYFEMKDKVRKLNGAPWEKDKKLCQGSHSDAEYGKVMEEAYNIISETLKEKAYFYEMKAGSDKEVINRYRINELPSFLCIYKDKFSKNEGIFPEEVLEELIDNFLTLVKGS